MASGWRQCSGLLAFQQARDQVPCFIERCQLIDCFEVSEDALSVREIAADLELAVMPYEADSFFPFVLPRCLAANAWSAVPMG